MGKAQIKPIEEADENFVDELKPGTELLHGQYTIESFLNAGGFGITYRAKDSLDRKVVIKECFPGAFCRRSRAIVQARSRAHQSELQSIVRLFVQEARSLAKLNHPNIVGVHQVFEDNETAYMALDFIEGRDLLDILDDPNDTLSPDEIKPMLQALLGAVAFVHDQGILHRDISPDNILVDADRRPVLIDFGAAREQASKQSRVLSALRVVKDGYSPQEFYIAGSEQGPYSDLYALAASFYHVMTGDTPPNSQARLASIATGEADPYQPLAGRLEGYDADFLKAMDKALEVLPKNRVQTAKEWLQLMEGKAVAAPVAAATPAAVAQTQTTSKGSTGKLLASVAVVALLAVGGFVAMQNNATSDDAAETTNAAPAATPVPVTDASAAIPAPVLAPVLDPVLDAVVAAGAVAATETVSVAEPVDATAEAVLALEMIMAAAAVQQQPLAVAATGLTYTPTIAADSGLTAAPAAVGPAAVGPAALDPAALSQTTDADSAAVAATDLTFEPDPLLQRAAAQALAEAQALRDAADSLGLPVRALALPPARPATLAQVVALPFGQTPSIAGAPMADVAAHGDVIARIDHLMSLRAPEAAAQGQIATDNPPLWIWEPPASLPDAPATPEIAAEPPIANLDSQAFFAVNNSDLGNDAIVLPVADEVAANVTFGFEAQEALVPGNEVAPDATASSIQSRWSIQLPYDGLFSGNKAETQIVAVNGIAVDSRAAFDQAVSETVELGTSPEVMIALSTVVPDVGTVSELSIALPVVNQTTLVDGTRFATKFEDGGWVTRVAAVADNADTDLIVGDQIFAFMPTSERFDQPTGLKELFDREAELGRTEFTFAVQRDGSTWVTYLNY